MVKILGTKKKERNEYVLLYAIQNSPETLSTGIMKTAQKTTANKMETIKFIISTVVFRFFFFIFHANVFS